MEMLVWLICVLGNQVVYAGEWAFISSGTSDSFQYIDSATTQSQSTVYYFGGGGKAAYSAVSILMYL